MIFSSFRDSVQEIAEMLLKHKPIIRVMTFVGHASGKGMKGFTQKEQLEVIIFKDNEIKLKLIRCVLNASLSSLVSWVLKGNFSWVWVVPICNLSTRG